MLASRNPRTTAYEKEKAAEEIEGPVEVEESHVRPSIFCC